MEVEGSISELKLMVGAVGAEMNERLELLMKAAEELELSHSDVIRQPVHQESAED